MKLIGIAGTAGSGKDTVADYLHERYKFARYSFADPIKAGVKAAFGLLDAHFTDRDLKEAPVEYLNNRSPRQLAQWFGTEFGRNLVAEDIWIRMADVRYRAYDEENQSSFGGVFVEGMVIPDVRFENEAEWIRERGGFVVHLVRPDVIKVHAHSSERGVAYVKGTDYVLMNVDTIDTLHERVDFMMEDTKCAA